MVGATLVLLRLQAAAVSGFLPGRFGAPGCVRRRANGELESGGCCGPSTRRGSHYADYSPDGTRIATAVASRHGGDTVVVWESQTRLHERAFEDAVHSVAFHPTLDDVLLVTWDRYAGIWDTRTNQLQTFSHPERVERARFSPDGTRIVTASADGTRLWDSDGTMRDLLIAHRRYMLSATFSPDGEHVLTTGGDGTARIWSPGATQALARFGQGGPRIRWVGADAAARVSLDVDGAVRLLAIGTDAPRVLIARAVGVTLDPRHNRVIAVDQDGGVFTYESTSGRQLALASGTAGGSGGQGSRPIGHATSVCAPTEQPFSPRPTAALVQGGGRRSPLRDSGCCVLR